MRGVLSWLDPRKKGGVQFIHVHLTLIVAIIVSLSIGLTGGFTARTLYDAAYFRAHYTAPLPTPRQKAPAQITRTTAPASASIDLARYPAVGDQGPMGACAAWATAWDASYEYRMLHPRSSLRFSPRQMYDTYSDTYNNGQDGGSWPDQDISEADTTGLLQFKAFPYPPYQVDDPLPTYDAYEHLLTADAARHRIPFQVHDVTGYADGQGVGIIDAIKGIISGTTTVDGKPHPALTAIGVYPTFDDATQTGGYVEQPQPGTSSRGGHEIVAIAYSDTIRFPDGEVGGVEIQNQWGTYWGAAGRAWVSYSYYEQVGFGVEYMTIGATAPKAGRVPPRAVDPRAPLHPAPPITGMPKPGAAADWYVHGVTLTTGQDVSGLLNAYGDEYHVWPAGLAATLGVESSLNPYAERWAAWPDQSCGLAQQILENVTAYTGIIDPRAACNWEEVPANSIMLEARLYAQYFAYQNNCVGWPQAYGLYNAGAGYPCSWYYNPSSEVAAHLAVFDGWYDYALAHWATAAPTPKPQPVFHFTLWASWARAHHKPVPAAWSRHRLTWPASILRFHPRLGGKLPLRRDRWFREHGNGFDRYLFAHGRALAWPKTHATKVVLR